MRISREHPLLLASASPRRRELLDLARIPFEVVRAGADESIAPGEAALVYAARVARAKFAAATLTLDSPTRERGAIVLTADTTVVLDGKIFGKPKDNADAYAMLRALSGVKHEVVTAFALGDPRTTRLVFEETVHTIVEMCALRDAEIDAYIATGEPHDKAGAYAIQGMASVFVKRIEGSHTNVIGLPTAEVASALRSLDIW